MVFLLPYISVSGDLRLYAHLVSLLWQRFAVGLLIGMLSVLCGIVAIAQEYRQKHRHFLWIFLLACHRFQAVERTKKTGKNGYRQRDGAAAARGSGS